MHWIGAQFGVCKSVESRDKSLNLVQNVSELFFTKYPWNPRSNTSNVSFFSFCQGFRNELIASYSGLRK